MQNRTDLGTTRVVLDAVEALLPIPADVLIVEQPALPSGDAWWVARHRVVLVRPGLTTAERRRALAHEAAHIVLRHETVPATTTRDIEAEADQLADALLAVATRAAA